METYILVNNTKALAKQSRKKMQVENLGTSLLATLFGQALRVLALTCDDLRSLC